MGVKMHKLGERCDLFQEGGRATDPAIDKRMDFHFNAILDVVSEWRKDKSQSQDTPLGGTVGTSDRITVFSHMSTVYDAVFPPQFASLLVNGIWGGLWMAVALLRQL